MVITSIVALGISVYALKKALFLLGKRVLSSRLTVSLLTLVVLAGINALTYESEYKDLLLYISLPIGLHALVGIVTTLFQFLYSAVLFIWNHSFTILLALVGFGLLYNPTGIAFPKSAAICYLLAISTSRTYLNTGILIGLYGLCFVYMYNDSDEYYYDANPFAELRAEIEMLYLYVIIFVFGYLLPNAEVQEVTKALSTCMQKGKCSPRYVTDLVGYLKTYARSNWSSALLSLSAYLPFIFLVMAGVRMLKGVVERIVSLFSPINAHSSDDIDAGRSEPHYEIPSLDDEKTFVKRLLTVFPSLSSEDARNYLVSKHWRFEETREYLQSPAGKASRAALERLKRLRKDMGPGSCSDNNNRRTCSQDIYPKVEATDQTVLRPKRRSTSRSGNNGDRSRKIADVIEDDPAGDSSAFSASNSGRQPNRKYTLHL